MNDRTSDYREGTPGATRSGRRRLVWACAGVLAAVTFWVAVLVTSSHPSTQPTYGQTATNTDQSLAFTVGAGMTVTWAGGFLLLIERGRRRRRVERAAAGSALDPAADPDPRARERDRDGAAH